MIKELGDIAAAMTARGKGILAADESTGTIKKRFDSVGVESTETTRRDYREMLFRTDAAMREHIGGVILFDETIRQKSEDGTPLVEIIRGQGAVPGIKVDKGAKPLPNAPGETVTEGLDGLRERLGEYHGMGARFAKWRAVIDIGRENSPHVPTAYAIHVNTHALARYAALCQEAGIVPIVEPEVLMDGDHNAARCQEVTEYVLRRLYGDLAEQGVVLEGTVLKPNMVVPGKQCPDQADIHEVAERTVTTLRRTVPAAVPGIAFLSGGMSDEDATARLNAMNAGYDVPWRLSFSYGRALQAAPLKAWSGNNANAPHAQAAFAHRARMNGLATRGEWRPELEREAA
ncbi:MAG: class I fructose-bisphosphate aldolase [Alphaproteobacteria bacterium]